MTIDISRQYHQAQAALQRKEKSYHLLAASDAHQCVRHAQKQREPGDNAPLIKKLDETLNGLMGDMLRTNTTSNRATPVLPAHLLAALKENYKAQSGESNIHIDTQLKADQESCFLPGSYELLFAALLALIDNGFKAMTAGGTLSVSIAENDVTETQRRWTIRVTDTGIGILCDARSYLVEPICETPYALNKYGLLLVKKIIQQQLKGHITVQSECGRGTTVCLIFDELRNQLPDIECCA